MAYNEDKVIKKSISSFIEEIYSFSDKDLYHYTKKRYISNIFNSKQLRMSRMQNMNDNNDNYENGYLFCFSKSSTESIPMWYLYSGVKADGIRIKFSKGIVEKLRSRQFYYINQSGERINIEVKDNIYLRPVLYYERGLTNDKDYRDYNLIKIKIFDDVYYVTEYLLNEYKNENPYFCKTMEWAYEKEMRLLIKYNNSEVDALYFSIEGLGNGLSVVIGPNGEGVNSEIYEPIRTYFSNINKEKLKRSALSSVLNIDLCRDCEKNIQKTEEKK